MGPFWIIPAIWWGLAGVIALAAVLPMLGQWLFTVSAVKTHGRLVKIGTKTWTVTSGSGGSRRTGSRTMHLPEVSFTVEGVEYVALATQGPYYPLWSVGDELPVGYKTKNPADARVLGWIFQYRRAALRLIWAAICALAGTIAYASL